MPVTACCPNMYGRHHELAIGPHIMFSSVVGLLQGDHACAAATPSKFPAETALTVALGHRDGVTQARILDQMHQGKGLCADGC